MEIIAITYDNSDIRETLRELGYMDRTNSSINLEESFIYIWKTSEKIYFSGYFSNGSLSNIKKILESKKDIIHITKYDDELEFIKKAIELKEVDDYILY